MAHQTHAEAIKTVWKTTLILGIVTVIEVVIALVYPESMPRALLNFLLIAMTILKAFYIVAIFMHLKFELRWLIITVLMPLVLLIWFIVAFLYEGDWFKYSREEFAPPQLQNLEQMDEKVKPVLKDE